MRHTYISYLGSLITNNERCKREIKIQDFYGKCSFQEEEYAFQQQTAFKCNEETSEMLRLEYSFWKALIPGRFGNTILWKCLKHGAEGGDQLD
jgi:hypothetical protein